jgi:hypothetical protein
MKNFSKSFTIKEVQIKMTLRFNLTRLDWQSSRKQITTNAGGDSGEKEPSYATGGSVS